MDSSSIFHHPGFSLSGTESLSSGHSTALFITAELPVDTAREQQELSCADTVLCPCLPGKPRLWTVQFLLSSCVSFLGIKFHVGCGYQRSKCAWLGVLGTLPFHVWEHQLCEGGTVCLQSVLHSTKHGWVWVHYWVSWVLQCKGVNSDDRRDVGVSCWLRKKGARYLNSGVVTVYYLTCSTACRLLPGIRACLHEARARGKGRTIPHPERRRSLTELSCLSTLRAGTLWWCRGQRVNWGVFLQPKAMLRQFRHQVYVQRTYF